MLKRLLYLAYYIKGLDKAKFARFVDHVSRTYNISKPKLYADILKSSLKYNISPLEYFQFHFYRIGHEQRKSFAGTGYMYEFQLKMNPKEHRDVLEDKIRFLKAFKAFVRRAAAPITELESNSELLSRLMSNPSGRVVAKGSKGQVGAEVKVLKTKDFSSDSLLNYMKEHHFDLLEEYVVQHPELMALSPSGLNTIRIFTQIEDGKLHHLGARLRITINSEVDNMAAGNPAAPIDVATGTVIGPAVFSDITQEPISIHPVTGKEIVGFQIPFWNEILAMMESAVFVAPENKSVGWDIAISENGPELIEGNHNWCKLLWQLPVGKGLKPELTKFIR